jgi:hypothetical protein
VLRRSFWSFFRHFSGIEHGLDILTKRSDPKELATFFNQTQGYDFGVDLTYMHSDPMCPSGSPGLTSESSRVGLFHLTTSRDSAVFSRRSVLGVALSTRARNGCVREIVGSNSISGQRILLRKHGLAWAPIPPQGPRRARRAPPGPTAARPVSAVINFFAACSKPCVICEFGGRAAARVRRCRTQFLCFAYFCKIADLSCTKDHVRSKIHHHACFHTSKRNELESCS